jgi:Tol biopolymer transport system component
VIEEHSLSPDGEWIAFDSDIRGEFDIYKQRLAGGSPDLVVDMTGDAFAPDWSPDGTEIAFYGVALEGTGKSEVFVVSADGGALEQLTDFPGYDSSPDWSPDGLAIAYHSQGPQGVGASNTWVVSRDSVGRAWGDPVQLTNFGCRLPAWAPDGASLVCDAGTEIARVSREGVVLSRLTMTAGVVDPNLLHFSPDGSRIYFLGTHEDGSQGVWWVPAAGSEAAKVVAFDDPALTVYTGFTVGPEHLYLTVAKYESDIWVMDLEW